MNVRVRAAAAADAEVLASWEHDEVFCEQAGWRPHATRGRAVEWWRHVLTSSKADLVRLIAVSGDTIVGYADLHGTAPRERELGYVVGPSAAWGRGLGTAVARAGLGYAFDELHLQHVRAEALVANRASISILRRIRMTETGLGGTDDFLGLPSRYLQFEINRATWTTAH